ncbi:phosphoenolpyruvate synthase [Granulosicoccus antarcticus]|uniref:Phosphoenolpyruvate synthase n=1 Tax=Granulosicoccus antarcticus IMCC3135 TaxID=1192854 RepID=A0A2Z2NV09_9GAMM|nr:phosphoenolpyruvate synthase [Granulosicoccus antarcticus]ASJ74345.1 Phosphoenolpyruvate synthase [Granulosicoccus antarcticus IMCC3135]
MTQYIRWFKELGMNDVPVVGGKNASLGEMIANLSTAGISVPDGFATTADAFREHLQVSGLDDRINARLDKLDTDDMQALTQTGAEIRQWVMETELPEGLVNAVSEAWNTISVGAGGNVSVAVRSSATAEDLPEASFAGQQETFLNVKTLDDVLVRIREVFASLYNDRAISYRVHQGFAHADVALSAGIQRMVRSDIGASGVMFSIDTESGFSDAVFITSSWGLGECVVQGSVNPDEFYVHKPTLTAGRPAILKRSRGAKRIKMIYGTSTAVDTVDVDVADQMRFSLNDSDVQSLATMAITIEKHYGRPMDIEWGKDGQDGKLYILQARPETVESRSNKNIITRYQLADHKATVLTSGRSIGQRIGAGVVRIVNSINDIGSVQNGDVLVTDMTDPDWEPVMKRAAAIVTNRGGRTCHAAIIARELGVPAVVGCNDATSKLTDGQQVTVSCAEGDTGFIYDGNLSFDIAETQLDNLPELPFKLTMNVGNPERAFGFSQLPHHGIGLARLEFIISNTIGIHPKALLNHASMPDDVQQQIAERSAGYANPLTFYVDKIVEGVATLAAAFAPYPVIVRLSDFKSNEYRNMVGGEIFEPEEENPMIGFRGASRYLSSSFSDCFELECRALKHVREVMGFTNVELMVPFVRTLEEADQVLALMAENGLERGAHGLRVVMMCEVPSNAIMADEFLERFDGFSIGSNDLTQLTLGLDRDSGLVAHLFDERDPAVKKLLSMAISAARKQNKYVGICGQGPSDHPDLARWLMEQGISSVSLNPDTIVETWQFLAAQQQD